MANGVDLDGNFYVESVDWAWASDTFDWRVTLLGSRTIETDGLLCHFDYRKQSDSSTGRYENVILLPRNGGEPHLACFARNWASYLASKTPVASPVFG